MVEKKQKINKMIIYIILKKLGDEREMVDLIGEKKEVENNHILRIFGLIGWRCQLLLEQNLCV